MNEQTKKALAWLDEVSTQAITEGQEGNTGLLNRLGKEPAFAYYLNNVHTRKVMTAEQFAGQMPQLMTEATRIMEQYELVAKQPERDARLTAVEENLQNLIGMVTLLMESQKPAEPAKPTKNGKKPATAVVVEVEETEADEPEADAESEA